MSQHGPGPLRFPLGCLVLTPKGQKGRVVSSYIEAEPSHDYFLEWDDEQNCWIDEGDEYLQHVYRVEVLPVDLWSQPRTEPWPEDMIKKVVP